MWSFQVFESKFGFKQVLNNNIAQVVYLQQYNYNKNVFMYILTKSLCYVNIKSFTYHL